MNLNAIAGAAVAAVQPPELMLVHISDGYVTQASGARAPKYLPVRRVMGQIQNLTGPDLRQVDSLNLQGTKRAIYLNGQLDGIVRNENKGGDLIDVPKGSVNEGTWLVAMVLESWTGWCKVAATLQRRPILAPAAGG